MQANSTQVSSNQSGPHPRLAELVARHLRHRHRASIADHNREAYRLLRERLTATGRPLVLDSFCGTGHSTRELARRHPRHLVVGIDRSAQRLARHPGDAGRDYLLLRADCEPLWQQLADDGLRVDGHYLLYPNPWPKAAHLGRRVHGHPGFAALLALGGQVELRSNWQLYAEEFCRALQLAGHCAELRRVLPEPEPLSLFERKYHRSGHRLWACRARLAP